jgi:hypothetical protein
MKASLITKRNMLLLYVMPLFAYNGGRKSKGMAGSIGNGKLVSFLFAFTLYA